MGPQEVSESERPNEVSHHRAVTESATIIEAPGIIFLLLLLLTGEQLWVNGLVPGGRFGH